MFHVVSSLLSWLKAYAKPLQEGLITSHFYFYYPLVADRETQRPNVAWKTPRDVQVQRQRTMNNKTKHLKIKSVICTTKPCIQKTNRKIRTFYIDTTVGKKINKTTTLNRWRNIGAKYLVRLLRLVGGKLYSATQTTRTPWIFRLSVNVAVWLPWTLSKPSSPSLKKNNFLTDLFFTEPSIVKDEPEVKPALPQQRRELSLSGSLSGTPRRSAVSGKRPPK